jgi:hypothetical protein
MDYYSVKTPFVNRRFSTKNPQVNAYAFDPGVLLVVIEPVLRTRFDVPHI